MICIYETDCMDFSSNGLGVVTPMSCIVTETLNGEWELTLVHPIDTTGKWQRFVEGRILRVPVPAASTPRISMTEVEHIYRVSVKKGSVPLYSSTGKRRKLVRKYNKDTEVVVISQENADWFEVVCPDGRKGYMSATALTFVRVDTAATDKIMEPRQLRDQPFRIYRIVSELDKITVYARHIFYDLLDNMLREYKGLNIAASTVVQGIASGCMSPHDFSFYSDVADAIGEFQFEHINPIEALLGDEGVVEKTNAEIARDWYDVFLTRRVGSDTGVEIREGKNLLGISYDLDATGVVTRIMPTGQDGDGEILYLPELYIDSPDIGNYPAPKWMHLEVTDAKEVVKGDGKKTKAQCYEEMRKAAQAEFDKGCDRPAVTLKVDFINCADTEEYRQYGFLQNIFLGDTVHTLVKKLGIFVSMRMTQYSYDCMTRKYTSMTLGTVEEALAGNMISSSQIPSGGISGSKLAGNSVGAYQLKAASVVANKIEAGAITTEKLAAGVVTAEKLAAGSVTAEKIAAGAVDAISINAVKARLAEITAEDIETDELAAELARITVLIAGTAAFDAATIRHLVSEAMNLEYGVAGQVFIKNLAVEYAQMVGAAIGKLCIKASDGKYYLLDVGADGRVTAVETTVTDGEIEAGQTSGGSVIVETNITAANLNTTNLLATYALINKIDAARIDVDELVGRKIFADALYTSKIYGGKSLELIVGDVSKAQRAADTAKTAADRAQSSVDNLAVGGRNYIRNGNFSAGENHWAQWGSPTTREVVEMSGKHWLHIAGNADLEFQGVSQVLPFMRNEPLAVSFTAYASAENTALTLLIHQMGLNNDPQIYNSYTLGTAPKRYSKTFTSADDATKATFKLMLGPRKSANDVYITDIKFERGNKATDWTPAPEDTNSRIDDAQTAADRAQSDIDGMAIGGRNLVLKSDAEKGPARNNQYDIAANRFIAGEYYACSVEMKSPSERSVDVYLNDDSGTNRINIPFSRWLGVKLTPDWVRYSFVYKANRDFDYPGKDRIVLRAYGTTADTADISVRRVKVEKGNKATDWTAAPEDTDGKIDNAQSTADNAQTTANGAQTAADNAQTAADNAQTTANGAQASADNAQNTASAARTATEQLQVSVEGVLEQTVDGVRIGRRINGQTAPNSLFAGPDGIDVCVENRAVSSFRSDYIKLLGMQIRVPEGIGGLIISSFTGD